MGTRKGDRSRGGIRGGDAGAAAATLEMHVTQNTRTHWVTQQWPLELAAGRVSDDAGLSLTPRG